jgi:hypothetical protein
MLHVEKVKAATERANWRKGYGTIRAFRLYMDGRIEATISRPYMRDVTRRGKLADGRVFFAGTSCKVQA